MGFFGESVALKGNFLTSIAVSFFGESVDFNAVETSIAVGLFANLPFLT